MQLRFEHGIVVLTDRQLLAKSPGEKEWQRWELRPGLTLKHRDHSGVGTLDLQDAKGLLARWRHTLASPGARRGC